MWGKGMEEATKTETVFEEENPFVLKFEQFFSQKYKKKIELLASRYPEKKSLEIDFKDLEEFDFELADSLLENPDYLIEAAEIAIKSIDVPILETENFKPFIRFYNLPKENQPLLRDIGSQHLGKLISVEGVIRQITDVLPRLKVAKWECKSCGNTYKTHQSGTTPKPPSVCECKRRDFRLIPNGSEFIDSQKIEIQEPLEKLRGSEQAVNLEIHATNDLVNKVSAGDRTRITGILRLRAPKDKKLVFMRYLEAIHLEETAKEFEEIEISKEEEKKIKELASNPNIYEMLTKSIAPAIYGHEKVKETIVLQLFGGVKKELPGKATIRGNIHVLLVGDPGVAKSQILMAVNQIAPKSIYVAGKTSSGVGLTASAQKDDFGEGGWTLKAGALVLASGGLANIDEFDKMDKEDRGAMHEAMEQQMVSVAKAGIVTRFKTETSILAAANPKFSRFDPYEPFIKQIDLPSTLISRFDLFFMIRDVLDRVKDEEITSSILKTHKAGEMILQEKKTGKKTTKEMQELKEAITPAIDIELLKKYISYARQKISPVLSEEAIKTLTEFYLNLREMGKKEGSYAATHRQLEGLVRLSEASARVRLSSVVEKSDAERAIKLLKSSLQDVVTDPETGRIDMDIINIGTTHSKLTAIRNVLNIIKEKAREQDLVPIIEVIEDAKTIGLEKDKVNEIISELKRKGEIYEKKHGFVSPVEK
jgi:replicative DNA helicase Mcm